MSKILVTGSNGQLGKEIQFLAKNLLNHTFVFTDVNELDISDNKAIKKFLSDKSFEYIINCAAYTAVDKAEQESEIANTINHIAVKNLAENAKEYGLKIIHISTDYVFDGQKNTPYLESDSVNPQSQYGKSKLLGEEALIKSGAKHIIIRTSWLYSSFGNNFVKTMLRLGSEREQLKVVFDQTGTPTYARDLANSIIKIVNKTNGNSENFSSGIYHYSNEGVTSWYDFAVKTIKYKKLKCNILPIETKDYPLPAKRPTYSVLNKTKIKDNFNIEIPHWELSLESCLSIL